MIDGRRLLLLLTDNEVPRHRLLIVVLDVLRLDADPLLVGLPENPVRQLRPDALLLATAAHAESFPGDLVQEGPLFVGLSRRSGLHRVPVRRRPEVLGLSTPVCASGIGRPGWVAGSGGGRARY